MAGHRRGSGRPQQEDLRHQRRLVQLETELRTAPTPSRRISAAAGYLCGAVKHAAPEVAEQIATEVVESLKQAGHRAFNASKGGNR